MSKSPLKFRYDQNDAISGRKIVVEAQKISKQHEISERTSRHGGRRITADDAEAWIESAYLVGKKGF